MLLNSVIYILYFLHLSKGIGQYIYYNKWPWPVTNGIESLPIQSESHVKLAVKFTHLPL